jgi:GTP-binding protein EngB required for normal cell division
MTRVAPTDLNFAGEILSIDSFGFGFVQVLQGVKKILTTFKTFYLLQPERCLAG